MWHVLRPGHSFQRRCLVASSWPHWHPPHTPRVYRCALQLNQSFPATQVQTPASLRGLSKLQFEGSAVADVA